MQKLGLKIFSLAKCESKIKILTIRYNLFCRRLFVEKLQLSVFLNFLTNDGRIFFGQD